jgi:hypothetical protein
VIDMIERVPKRHPSSSFPDIDGVRLAPVGGDASLVNLSSSGVLVECPNRVRVETALTVTFEGTFKPSSVAGRVTRCEVSRLSSDGSMRFHVGIEFDHRIALRADAAPAVDEVSVLAILPPPAAVSEPPVLRNRW